MEELTKKIERYLSGEMSLEEKSAFDIEMEKDPALQKEFDLYRITYDLLEANAYIELKEKVSELNSTNRTNNSIKFLGRVAAVLLVLLIPTYFYISAQYKDKNLYVHYAQPYPDRITKMGGDTDEMLFSAMEHYNEKEYEIAAIEFSKIRQQDSTNEQIAIYEAVSLMNSDQADRAVKLLEEIRSSSSPKYQLAIQWQLILAYLANGEGDKSNEMLKSFLRMNDGYQQKNAKKLFDDLNSIWR